MKKVLIFIFVLTCLYGEGCSTTKMKVVKTAPKLPPYSGPVCLIKSPLPSSFKYVSLGRIASGKHFYGSLDGVFHAMADKARSSGANAVINVRAHHTVDAIAWSVPKAVGMAVRTESANLDCRALGGDAY